MKAKYIRDIVIITSIVLAIIFSLAIYNTSSEPSGFERNVIERAALQRKYDSLHSEDFYKQSYFIYYADSARSETDKAYADSLYNVTTKLVSIYDTIAVIKHKIDSLDNLINDYGTSR